MGKHDYVREVFLELGVKEYFWKVAQKPGRPLFFGESGGTLIFGLPGNPVSSFVCFMEYVWPTCERFMGLIPINKVTARLVESFPRETEKRRYLLGHVEMDGREMVAKPSGKYGSHMFTSALMANAILESPRGEGPLKSGQEITARLLPWSELQ
jgi:molybdopterin molybdotransferase